MEVILAVDVASEGQDVQGVMLVMVDYKILLRYLVGIIGLMSIRALFQTDQDIRSTAGSSVLERVLVRAVPSASSRRTAHDARRRSPRGAPSPRFPASRVPSSVGPVGAGRGIIR